MPHAVRKDDGPGIKLHPSKKIYQLGDSFEGKQRRRRTANEVHDQDAPFDGQLLNDDESATLLLLCDFGDVNGDLRAGDANANAVEHTSSDQHTETVNRRLNGCTGKPPGTREKERIATAYCIGDRTSDGGPNNRASSEGRTNGALSKTGGFVEEGIILLRTDNGRHRRNVETKKHPTHGGNDGHEVGVVTVDGQPLTCRSGGYDGLTSWGKPCRATYRRCYASLTRQRSG